MDFLVTLTIFFMIITLIAHVIVQVILNWCDPISKKEDKLIVQRPYDLD